MQNYNKCVNAWWQCRASDLINKCADASADQGMGWCPLLTGGGRVKLTGVPASVCAVHVELAKPSMLVQGEQWDWHLPKHRELDQALSDVLAAIHSRGVLHGDVHDGNILVTADRRIVIVDFEDAKLQAPATATDAEMHDLSRQLFHPVQIWPSQPLFQEPLHAGK